VSSTRATTPVARLAYHSAVLEVIPTPGPPDRERQQPEWRRLLPLSIGERP
jgi:hypothetical protein